MEPLFDPKWLLKMDSVLIDVVRHDRTLYPAPEQPSQEELVSRLRDAVQELHHKSYPVMLADPATIRHSNAFYSDYPPLMLGEPRGTVVLSGYQATGRQTYTQAIQDWAVGFNIPAYVLPEEHDPKKKNKLAVKARQGAKGSQNSRGRRWWESR
jgi:hypothetical protein